MPPVLDPENSKLDGLAFIGLSLCRKSERGHPDTGTHQQAFDLDRVQDRDYQYIFSTNDDGWLVGGGEPGPPHSYKLPARDSAHVEIMRVGTYNPALGGLDPNKLLETLRSGKILIPEMTVVPTGVVANGDQPPELEIRFDMIPDKPNLENPLASPLPINWQLRFLHNQLFKEFKFPSRFCPGAFHSTILRKAEFRSEEQKKAYFCKCQAVVNEWLERGQQPLVPPGKDGVDPQIKTVHCKKWKPPMSTKGDDYLESYYRSGVWLFTDRNNPTHQIMPNFLPPYDTPAKRKIILDVLKEEWDETTLSWKPLYEPPENLHLEVISPYNELTSGLKTATTGEGEAASNKAGESWLGSLCSAPELCGSNNTIEAEQRESMAKEFEEEKSNKADSDQIVESSSPNGTTSRKKSSRRSSKTSKSKEKSKSN